MKKDFEFLLPSEWNVDGLDLPSEFRVLSRTENIPFVKTIAECLQAERNGLDGVIWDAEDFDQLEELIPKKAAYGWMLVSLNIPVYFHLTDIDQLTSLENMAINGLFAEDSEILLESQKKVETLFGE